jgi:hypothetical protein
VQAVACTHLEDHTPIAITGAGGYFGAGEVIVWTCARMNTANACRTADGRSLVSQAGTVLLWETLRVTGLARGLSAGLAGV